MIDPVRGFYDDLASDYHLLFADWEASIERQARVLDGLISVALGAGPLAVLDCACGIGTQTIGLALRGHRVHATDLSPSAVARLDREVDSRALSVTTGVADVRSINQQVPGTFDVVLACDNALPHLPHVTDLNLAAAHMAAKLRPEGLFLISVRDYDELRIARPRTEGPRVLDGPDGRRITFQVWDWSEDGRAYRLQQFIVRQTGDGWQTEGFAVDYQAYGRADFEDAVRAAGLSEIRWLEPEESGFYQIMLTARAPT